MSRFRKHRQGFSLVELLVSVTIISMLIAMSMPYLAQAKQNAKQVACLSNLHQIGLTTHMYNDTFEGVYPDFFFDFSPGNSNTIVVLVVPKRAATTGFNAYDRKLILCPADEDPSEVPVADPEDLTKIEWVPVSYGFNIELDLFKVRRQEIRRPSDFVTFYDGEMGRGSALQKGTSNHIQGHFFGTNDFVQKTMQRRHEVRPDQANVLYADSHAEPATEILARQIQMDINYVHNPGGGGSGGGGGGGGGGKGGKK